MSTPRLGEARTDLERKRRLAEASIEHESCEEWYVADELVRYAFVRRDGSIGPTIRRHDAVHIAENGPVSILNWVAHTRAQSESFRIMVEALEACWKLHGDSKFVHETTQRALVESGAWKGHP